MKFDKYGGLLFNSGEALYVHSLFFPFTCLCVFIPMKAKMVRGTPRECTARWFTISHSELPLQSFLPFAFCLHGHFVTVLVYLLATVRASEGSLHLLLVFFLFRRALSAAVVLMYFMVYQKQANAMYL